ncbi:MAG TPA: amino acid ABC transporter permease [Nocardioidaceae bacterium]|nr:amino acid ABC transporter permease [Nocardioidaceae bacterium]
MVFFALIGTAVVTSPGWHSVQTTFFSWDQAKASFPHIARGFWVTIKLFMTIEPIVLVSGLIVALIRISKSPVMFPLRVVAVAYVDLFRGIPTLLLVYLIGFGLPALELQGIPKSVFWLGVIALSLSYTAYVAEVIRAGIASVHPSQRAAARSLGLSDSQTIRTVVLPQALRNVAPPLLNDFISLQKDTALVGSLGLVEALREAYIDTTTTFNYTPFVVAALFYIALTIPLARITDHLGSRALERQFSFAGGQK